MLKVPFVCANSDWTLVAATSPLPKTMMTSHGEDSFQILDENLPIQLSLRCILLLIYSPQLLRYFSSPNHSCSVNHMCQSSLLPRLLSGSTATCQPCYLVPSTETRLKTLPDPDSPIVILQFPPVSGWSSLTSVARTHGDS